MSDILPILFDICSKRAFVVGGGIAHFTDVAATSNVIIRAVREKQSALKAAKGKHLRAEKRTHLKGLANMRALSEETGVPIEVYGLEASMTSICKQAMDYICGRD